METTKLVFEIPAEIAEKIGQDVVKNMKDQYYWGLTKAISEKLEKRLTDDGMIDRIVEESFKQMKLDEKEFYGIIGKGIQEQLIMTMSTIANETIKKIDEKIKSYGFINIGR